MRAPPYTYTILDQRALGFWPPTSRVTGHLAEEALNFGLLLVSSAESLRPSCVASLGCADWCHGLMDFIITRPGKHRKSYGKWSLIVSFPIKWWIFP
jgi:hypothetical protein